MSSNRCLLWQRTFCHWTFSAGNLAFQGRHYGTTGAFNFAQWYVHNYSSNWGQEPFDLETEFNIEINGSSISGGLGGNDPAYCEINWPEDPYHLAIYSFVSEYVLEEGGGIGCFFDDFNLDQTKQPITVDQSN